MNSKIILLMALAIVVTDGGKGSNDEKGLDSIKTFCEGKGRLDDFRDIVQDVYFLRSRRSSTVS